MGVPMFMRVKGNSTRSTTLDFVTAVNISAGGALIATRRYLPPGAEVTLEVPVLPMIPDSLLPSAQLKRDARVARGGMHKQMYILAMQFEEPLAEAGLVVRGAMTALDGSLVENI